MKKQMDNQSNSNGFAQSVISQASVTLKMDKPWIEQRKQLSLTSKDSFKIQNQQTDQRKQMIQNFLESSLDKDEDDLYLKTTMNLKNVSFGAKYQQQQKSLRPQSSDGRLETQDPFDQRKFNKTMNFLVGSDEINQDYCTRQPFQKFLDKNQPINVIKPPGVLKLGQFNYGNVYEPKRLKDPIVLIQSFIRGFLQRLKYIQKKKSLKNMLHDHRMNKTVDRMIQNDQVQAQKLIDHLDKQKKQTVQQNESRGPGKLGISKDNPFFTCVLEILGDKGLLNQDDFMDNNQYKQQQSPIQIKTIKTIEQTTKKIEIKQAKLRPNLKKLSEPKKLGSSLQNDNNGIWSAFEKKQCLSKKNQYEEKDDENIKYEYDQDIPKTKQLILLEKKQNERNNSIQNILQREVPIEVKQIKQTQKSKKYNDSVEENIVDEDIDEIVSVSGAVLEENIQFEQEDQQEQSINEYLEEDFEEDGSIIQSAIKESYQKESIISGIKESISGLKESVIQEYVDDFEGASQSLQKKMPLSQSQSKGKDNIEINEYEQDQFESYSENNKSEHIKKKSVTFDQESALQPRVNTIGAQPLLTVEEQPIKFIKPRQFEEDSRQYILAKREAENSLALQKERYRELRQLSIDDEAFSQLKKEHYDLLKVQSQVGGLLKSTRNYWKHWNNDDDEKQKIDSNIPLQSSGQADLLYSKFQFEFHRLLTVNSLGTKFQGILNSIDFLNQKQESNTQQKQTQNIPLGSIQTVLQNIEQQQYIVQQVLQQVLSQMSSLFSERETVNELKQLRQGMDQKIQHLIFKQDKLLNDRVQQQMEKRNRELKTFIQDLFDKQKRDLGAVKLLPSQKLQDALQKSFSAINPTALQQVFEQSLGVSKEKLDLNRKDSQKSLLIKDDNSSYYQQDFEDGSEVASRIKSDNGEENQYQNSISKEDSISMDYEVNEYESQPDIDWQTDINLFKKQL